MIPFAKFLFALVTNLMVGAIGGVGALRTGCESELIGRTPAGGRETGAKWTAAGLAAGSGGVATRPRTCAAIGPQARKVSEIQPAMGNVLFIGAP